MYTIQMGNGTLSQAKVEISIRGRNDAPVAVNDLFSCRQAHNKPWICWSTTSTSTRVMY